MTQFIILSPAGAAYQKNQNNVNWITSASNWKFATKFNNVENAISEMENDISSASYHGVKGREKYRVVEFNNPTKIHAQNGNIYTKPISQFIPFNSFR